MRSAAVVGLAVAVAMGGALMAREALYAAPPQPDSQQRIVIALDRLTWGIAPGQVAAVEKVGLKKWVDNQLHPDRIPENPALTAALAPLDTLRMSPGEMLEHYPSGEMIRQMAMGKRPLPSDTQLRVVAEREIAAYRERTSSKSGPGGTKAAEFFGPMVAPPPPPPNAAAALAGLLSPEQIQALTTGSQPQRLAAFAALPAPTQSAVIEHLPRGADLQFEPWVPAGEAHEVAALWQPQQVVTTDLTDAKVLRAVETNRQLEDVLTDFWFNHFNIWVQKGIDRELITSYERDAIRPHVLGKFSDLLLATAKSPAMLFYLDNWQSVDPNADARIAAQRYQAQVRRAYARFGPGAALIMPRLPPPVKAKPATRGLNENYGREVMELHTVGLHYTQADVIAVARCFTGWTIKQPQIDPTFFYNDQLHDKGPKTVLGVTIPAGGGMSDGLKVIQILSRSPDTAQHIAYELAQRFVADDPPPALVNRMAASFMKSDGDLRQVMATMINSPEFWNPKYERDKVKSPLEMVVSAVRGLGAQVSNPERLTQVIAQMGQPLYGKEPPTGYKNVGEAWVSSSGLIARLNFALQLARNQVPGVQVDLTQFASGEDRLLTVEQNMLQGLLHGQASPQTTATIKRELARTPDGSAAGTAEMSNPVPASPAQVQLIAGLVLGSPDFQKR